MPDLKLPDLPPMEYAAKFGFKDVCGFLFWFDIPIETHRKPIFARDLERLEKALLAITACAIRACEMWERAIDAGKYEKGAKSPALAMYSCKSAWEAFEAQLLQKMEAQNGK